MTPTIRIEAPNIGEATAALDGDRALVVNIPEPAARAAADESAKVPLRIGFHPTPSEYGIWLTKLPTPWFTRVFFPPGRSLPAWGGNAINGLPATTIRHISFKDRVAPAVIVAFLNSIPASVAQVWLTWNHEGDIDWAGDIDGYINYWKMLRDTVDGHPARPRITLINVHTQYAARYKRQQMDWRAFMLPGVADVDSWDCYRPAIPDVYEAPEALLGLALTAGAEFGVRTHITEFGSHLTSWDTDGTGLATWYREACSVMDDAGVEAVGFWCNVDGKLEYRPMKAALLAQWKTLMTKYNAVR